MKRPFVRCAFAVSLLVSLPLRLGAAAALGKARVPCHKIRGRAHLFVADGKLRLWQVGTHHEFEPDASSWQRVEGWLKEGAPGPAKPDGPPPLADVSLFGDFVVCPTEPYRAGAVQRAEVKSVTHRRYVEGF